MPIAAHAISSVTACVHSDGPLLNAVEEGCGAPKLMWQAEKGQEGQNRTSVLRWCVQHEMAQGCRRETLHQDPSDDSNST